jgi:hypothetical protein
MSAEQALALLREDAGRSVCLRVYQRHDGTVLTSDCSVGAKKKRIRRLALVGGIAASVVAADAIVTATSVELAGGIERGLSRLPQPPAPRSSESQESEHEPPPQRWYRTMGRGTLVPVEQPCSPHDPLCDE